MKIINWETLVDEGDFSRSRIFADIKRDIYDAAAQIVWPPDAPDFTILATKHANGVKPIKDAFTAHLSANGWELEKKARFSGVHQPGAFDAYVDLSGFGYSPFVVEWETGNISSSHRAINKIGAGIREGILSGGVLIVPSHALYPYLTDRVGNARELLPYHNLWRSWGDITDAGYFAIVTVEHDNLSHDPSFPSIRKGTDGRALL